MATKRGAKSGGKRRQGSRASSKVKRAVHARRHGELRAGLSSKKGTSRKAAMPTGFAKTRRPRGRVTKKRSAKKR